MFDGVNSVLVVAAHADDEALGCGGTMARLAQLGADIHVAFLTDGVGARGHGADDAAEARDVMANRAAAALGNSLPTRMDFPDNALDTVPLLDIVVAIERRVRAVAPQLILTHAAGDLNRDHRLCAQAVITACRPLPGSEVRTILGFEVLSSSEWAFGVTGMDFTPNVFVDIGQHFEAKLAALRCYDEEMRDYPHARSYEGVEALARMRGVTAGVALAEAFQLYRSIV